MLVSLFDSNLMVVSLEVYLILLNLSKISFVSLFDSLYSYSKSDDLYIIIMILLLEENKMLQSVLDRWKWIELKSYQLLT